MTDKDPVDLNGQLPLPPEIWALVFSKLNLSQENCALVCRLVCKFWCGIINEYVDFQAVLNQKKLKLMKSNSNIQMLRVNHWIIKNLIYFVPKIIPDSNKMLFWDADLVTKLTIEGKTNPKLFFLLVSNFTNLKELTINKNCLCTPNLLDDLLLLDDTLNQKNLFSNLQCLKIDGVLLGNNTANKFQPISNNFGEIMCFKMWSLNTLSISFNKFNLEDSQLVPFLVEGAPNLKNLWIGVEQEYMEALRDQSANYNLNNNKSLHLRTLSVNHWTVGDSRIWWEGNWLPILERQRSLEELSFQIYIPASKVENPDECLKFNDVKKILTMNKAALKSIVLQRFTLSAPLDAGLFAEMRNLEKMELRLAGYSFRIFNLTLLPESIQVLRLWGFSFDNDEVAVMGTDFKNLKVFEVNDKPVRRTWCRARKLNNNNNNNMLV